jgi:glycine/D-amino acid oxidase-like deaminating enzyme
MMLDNSPTHGLWARTAPEAPPCPPLSGKVEADVTIIGAGYTGVSAALSLAEAGKSVVVLDAHQPGWGCSGRNGGQVNPGLKLDIDEIGHHYGPDRRERVVEMTKGACDYVFGLIDRHGIDCEARRPGYVQGGVGKHGIRELRDRCAQWQRVGRDARFLDARESAALLGTDAYDACMLHMDGGSVQPLAYLRGLVRAAQAAGAVVHGDSEALAVERSGQDWCVRTQAGAVTARNVLIGTNGYTGGLWPGLARAVVPVASLISATAPLSDNVRRSILPGGHAVSEVIRVQVYYRIDVAGRFVIGGAGPVWGAAEDGSPARVRERALRYFPQLADVKWEHDWAGYPAMTWDHAPKLMELAPGVLAGMGYNGRGLAMATVMGDQMAREVLGEGTALPVTPLYRTPFHALRKIGIAARLEKWKVQDRLDRV